MEARAGNLLLLRLMETWLDQAFGKFAERFRRFIPGILGTEPVDMGTDGLENAFTIPRLTMSKADTRGLLGKSTHWVRRFVILPGEDSFPL